MKKSFKLLLVASVFTLAACAVTPVQYNSENIAPIASDLVNSAPLPSDFETKPLTLEDARKMAATRNVAYRQRVNRMMVQLQGENAQIKNMLPQIYTKSFGRWRNNTNASVGVRVDDLGSVMPEEFYTAQDQSLANSNVTLTWNLLDLALHSHNKAGADIKGFDLIENNRAGCHQLMVDVERAYWRKAAFDRASKKRDWLNSRIEYGLQLSSEEASKDEEKELTEWMYQRELIDIKRWYESMYRGLASADSDLKKLINVPQGTELIIDATAPPAGDEFGSTLGGSLNTQFIFAFENRPEIRRHLYTIDQTKLNNEKDVLRRLPGLSLFMSANNDTNSFALNQDFLLAGVSLSWDVMGLVNMGKAKRQGKARLAIEEAELDVIATTIMAQVALANEDVKNLKEEMKLAWKAKDVQAGITQKLRDDVIAGKNREIYLIKEELLLEMSILREDIATAELRAAEARLAQSLGVMTVCDG